MTIDEINEAGRLLDPDGWIDITEIATAPAPGTSPRPNYALACCGRPADDHPRADLTTHGTCSGPHAGTEVSMHWDGRRYTCGLCALDAFHTAVTNS